MLWFTLTVLFFIGFLYRKEVRQWISNQSVNDLARCMEATSKIGNWFVGIHGAALVGSIAFLIAAYTSLPSASDHICIASYFVSEAMVAAQVFGKALVMGGLAAIIVAIMPTIVELVRSFNKVKALSRDLEFSLFILQIALIIISAFTAGLIIWVLFIKLDVSPDSLLKTWHEFGKSCASYPSAP